MKVVLTAGPNVGKSTLITKLEQLGFRVIHEVATDVINDGGPMPWDDHEAFQHEVLNRQMAKEQAIPSGELVFLDRGTFDGIPYREIYGRQVPDFFAQLQPCSYDVCFLLDAVPWENDGLRYEDPSFTSDIKPLFARVYKNADVPVVNVPYMSVQSRLQFILDVVGKALGRNLTATPAQAGGAPVSSERKEPRWYFIPSMPASTCSPAPLATASSF
jgi:predicted ATPase